MAAFKEKKISISITIPKVFLWFSGLWLFICAIISSVTTSNILVNPLDDSYFTIFLFVHNSLGDRGSIILITSFLFLVATTFIPRNRYFKLVIGISFLILALIGIIGALVTSTSFSSTWVIFVGELFSIIGSIFWILEGLDLLKTKNS